ncbi:MAG: ABC transporter ATP-binding protein [Pseudomonadota bacterium]
MALLGPPKPITLSEMWGLCAKILGPEKDFYYLAAVYGAGISLLSLATPISVQMLINTVANTGLATPLIVLSATLFGLLSISALLNALRIHLMEIFGRRFFARMFSEMTLRAIYAQNPFFHDDGRAPLFNRFFDIIIVQKRLPLLLIGGFTLFLQAVVGFILVSSYHPLFLGFNIVFVALIWLVWAIWGRSAVRAAIDLSHKKHAAAAWLEGIGSSNGYFKSSRHIAHALAGADAVTRDYINEHRRLFRQYFAQTVSYWLMYALASASLLGLGGWLVIQGQLSLGQLVAAELVLSAVFFSVAQLGQYLGYFYDLCAAIEELSLFYKVELEEPGELESPAERVDATLTFTNVRGDARGTPATINVTIPSGAAVMAAASGHGVQRLMTHVLKRFVEPEAGVVTFGGADLLDTEVHCLRQEILALDRPAIIETTLRDYLRLACENRSADRVIDTLDRVGLSEVVAQLPEGLDTHISGTGWPLSVAETMRLKLAAAIIARPKVLIINQLYDLIPDDCMKRALEPVLKDPSSTLIYFSNRVASLGFKTFLYMDNDRQTYFNDFDEFAARRAGAGTQPIRLTFDTDWPEDAALGAAPAADAPAIEGAVAGEDESADPSTGGKGDGRRAVS